MAVPLETELYTTQISETKTNEGRQLLVSQTGDSVIVYVVGSASAAKSSVSAGTLKGSLLPSSGRVWLATDFLYVLHETKRPIAKHGKRVLALWILQEVYVSLLSDGSGSQRSSISDTDDLDDNVTDVVLQWLDYIDPIRHIDEWECVLIYLNQQGVDHLNTSGIKRIADVTEFVTSCHKLENEDKINEIVLPIQRPFIPDHSELCQNLFLQETSAITSDSIFEDFGCMSEALKSAMPSSSQEANPCRDIVINLYGAFNPMHTRHVAAIVNTKSFLEENNNFHVVGGYISVCTDDVLKTKFKEQKEKTLTIKGLHRINLARLAVKDYPWIEVLDKPVSFAKCTQAVRGKQKHKVRIANVFGTDRAFVSNGKGRWTVRDTEITVCVMREGQWDRVKQMYEQDLRTNVLLKRDFYFLPVVSENVSSTGIRRHLKQMKAKRGKAEKEGVVRELVSVGWINQPEADYLVKHEKKLYF